MKGVIKKTALRPGKTVAIFGGVHGNERVGVEAVRWAVATIEPECGTIYFVEANPAAIGQDVRFVGKNLNRCFVAGNPGTTGEEMRARELMGILDECDALLDIHSSNSKDATPFVICEADGMVLAATLDFPIVTTGWDRVEPGAADGYMFQCGKPGVCIECGSVFTIGDNLVRAQDSIRQFLEHFGISSEGTPQIQRTQRHIQVYFAALRQSEQLVMKEFADFEPLVSGEVFARDGQTEYVAKEGDCIIFARPNAAIGAEAFILGKERKV